MPKIPADTKDAKKAPKKVAPKPAPAAPKAPPKPPVKVERKVLYDQITVAICRADRGTALTVDKAKELLGWHEVPKDHDHILLELDGKCYAGSNNDRNREFYPNVMAGIRQDMLMRDWRGLNGETLIIGKTGVTVSAQHRLTAFIAAVEEWRKNKDKWLYLWPEEPTLDCIIVFGVEEDDDTVNTVDTGRPRSLKDALYRSDYFKDTKGKERKKLASITAFAVQQLWHRTGAKLNSFAPLRTHQEAMDFIDRHPKLIDAARHVYEEDSEGKISFYLKPGAAAGMLYLMAAAKSDAEKYRSEDLPKEGTLDLDLWDKAEEFFVHLAGGNGSFQVVRKEFGEMLNRTGGSFNERCAFVVKAWNSFLQKKTIKADDLSLLYTKDDEGLEHLAECPTVGGIDMGEPEVPQVDDEPEAQAEAEGDAPAEKEGKKGKKSKKDKKAAVDESQFKDGMKVTVNDDDGEWEGTITEMYDGQNGKVAKVKQGNGKVFEALLANCAPA